MKRFDSATGLVMGWTDTKHRCDLPDTPEVIALKANNGSTWHCDFCGRDWTLDVGNLTTVGSWTRDDGGVVRRMNGYIPEVYPEPVPDEPPPPVPPAV